MRVVCEVGPGTVRVLGPVRSSSGRSDTAESGVIDAVIYAGGEPLALLDERPVATAALWRSVFGALLDGADEVLLVHPSWWSPTRMGPVVEAARQVVDTVTACPRYRLLHRDTVFIEIGPEIVVIGDRDGVVGAETRCFEVDFVVDSVVDRVAGDDSVVHIDAPVGVSGAAALGSLIARRLRTVGRPIRQLTDHHLVAAATRSVRSAQSQPPRRPARRAATLKSPGILVGTAVLSAITVAGLVTSHGIHTRETELVEGRVAVRIPADWPAQRVTAGPGSPRVQVMSPADPDAVLHITQSPAPTDDLAATATALQSAARAQPAGVFVEFNTDDRRAGRPAVTYREVRPGHDIRWTVVLAGRVRISIGCQSAPGRAVNVDAACERAISSAREIG